MNGNINIDKQTLSGNLSQPDSLSGNLSQTGSLSGNVALGMNYRKYYTKDEVDELINDVIVSADTYLEFPVIGDSHSLYVDTSNNTVYRWNEEELKYFCIGRDYENIEFIDANFGN